MADLKSLIAADWADALEPVHAAIAAAGEFLRAEIAAGHAYLPAGPNILRAFREPMANVQSYPPDVAVMKNSLGVEVPYIVRIETGTANRAIYEIAILHDPVKEPEPTAWS